MNNSTATYCLFAATAAFFSFEPRSAIAQGELRPVPLPQAAWQKDVNEFESELRKLVTKARVPEQKAFEKRLRTKPSDLEIITDGYGGVVDFNAAEGTVQYVANGKVEGRPIDWEFELAKDAKPSYDKSITLVPQFATKSKGEGKQNIPLLMGIRVKESKAGPFKAGDRVRLKAYIDDFSRFRKDYNKATGLVAIYYLEDLPTAVFFLRLEKAEMILLDSK